MEIHITDSRHKANLQAMRQAFQRGTAFELSPDASALAAAQKGNGRGRGNGNGKGRGKDGRGPKGGGGAQGPSKGGRASSEERPPKTLPCWYHNRKVHKKAKPCLYGDYCRCFFSVIIIS